MTTKIIRNAAECPVCGDVVESKHDHDMHSCECGATFVDGGLSYLRRGWSGDLLPIERSEFDFGDTSQPCSQCGEPFGKHNPRTGAHLNCYGYEGGPAPLPRGG